MDPRTGKFHNVDEYEKEHGKPVPPEWPVFEVGDAFELNGYPFRVSRINRSSLVLTPVIANGETGARQVMDTLMYGEDANAG